MQPPGRLTGAKKNGWRPSPSVPTARSSSAMAGDESLLPQPPVRALGELAEVLPVHQARYALIGGIAAGVRGRRRYTDDIDLLLTVPQLRLPGLLEALVERGFTCDVIPTVREWTQQHMVVMSYD